ncbi:MAG: protein phosphatase 2C domain-containing protein [Pseudomonadota bacterium]
MILASRLRKKRALSIAYSSDSWRSYIPDLSILGFTDAGNDSCNQDSMAWDQQVGVIALADGMGRQQAGEVASAMAVGLFVNGFKCWLDEMGSQLVQKSTEQQANYIQSWIKMQIQSIHDSICDAANLLPECKGMGSTLCAVLFWGQLAWVIHVGDSRVYLYDKSESSLKRVTHDHSAVQQHIDAGFMSENVARRSARKHELTRALGVGENMVADVSVESFSDQQVFLLCSDGLTDVVSESLMTHVLKEHSLALVGRLLLGQAKTLGGQDNVSILLASKE